MFSTTTTRAARASWAIAATVGMVVALAACAPASDTAKDDGLAGGSEKTYEDWSLAFNSCLRAEGIDVPEAGTGGGSGTLDLSGTDPAAFEQAQKTCMTKVGAPPAQDNAPSASESNEMMLLFAKCIRDAGVDYPDPAPAGSGELAPAIDISAIDPATLSACETKAGLAGAERSE